MHQILKDKKSFYKNHLKDVILPYWLTRGVDEEFGGFYTLFTPDGKELRTQNKFAWSQGRISWMYAKLASTKADIFTAEERAHMLKLSKEGVAFILNHCLTPDYTCHLLTDREGNPLETVPGQGTIGNTFADCFITMGLAACAEATNDSDLLEKAYHLYYSIEERVGRGEFITAPYPIPRGFLLHSVYMMMVNVTNELWQALSFFGDPRASYVDAAGKKHCEYVLTHFAQPDGVVLEQIRADGKPAENLLGRYINVGHVIENMWFVALSCARRNEKASERKALDLLWNTYQMAKDDTYSGLHYYLDRSGGKPAGELTYPEDEQIAPHLTEDWNVKLWWPHTEALYGLLLGFMNNQDDAWLEEFQALHEYVFKTFPNPNREVGEWLMLQDCHGNVLESFGGTIPPKCPYHAVRNLLMIIELLDE